jgi:hypothetical protein
MISPKCYSAAIWERPLILIAAPQNALPHQRTRYVTVNDVLADWLVPMFASA